MVELALRERRPSPERERRAKRLRPFELVTRRVRRGHEQLEAAEIRLLVRDAELVPGGPQNDRVGAEEPAELMDRVVEGSDRRARRLRAPQRFDQAAGRDSLAGVKDEERERGPLLRPRKRYRAAVDERFDRPEYADLDLRSPLLTPRRRP